METRINKKTVNSRLLFSSQPLDQLTVDQIHYIFSETYKKLKSTLNCPIIYIEFYQFVGINHTVRFKKDKLYVRLSDLFKYANASLMEALATILLSKLLSLYIPPVTRKIYRDFVGSREMQVRSMRNRRKRGYKLLTSPQGEQYNLILLFSRINEKYFRGKINNIKLGWSLKKSYNNLGHFDPSHRSITISCLLDSSKVPEVVVSFVLFHEMLHVKIAGRSLLNVRTNHRLKFKEEERKFYGYEQAIQWLKNGPEQIA